jgi:hypothetical protein
MVMSETMMVVPMLTLLSDDDDAFMTNAFLTSVIARVGELQK